jgi:hypothetical protein
MTENEVARVPESAGWEALVDGEDGEWRGMALGARGEAEACLDRQDQRFAAVAVVEEGNVVGEGGAVREVHGG